MLYESGIWQYMISKIKKKNVLQQLLLELG